MEIAIPQYRFDNGIMKISFRKNISKSLKTRKFTTLSSIRSSYNSSQLFKYRQISTKIAFLLFSAAIASFEPNLRHQAKDVVSCQMKTSSMCSAAQAVFTSEK